MSTGLPLDRSAPPRSTTVAEWPWRASQYASVQPAIYEYLNEHHRRAKAAPQEVVAAVKRVDPGPKGEAAYNCFTGAVYHVVPIIYDERQLGRIILGPFLPADVSEVPPALLGIDPKIEPERARLTLAEMPGSRIASSTFVSPTANVAAAGSVPITGTLVRASSITAALSFGSMPARSTARVTDRYMAPVSR